jgi:hypothetical protein
MDHYTTGQIVVRHIQTISDSYTYNSGHWAFASAELVYTPTQLLTECSSGWVRNMPATMQAIVTAYNAAPTGMTSDFIWGWKKTTPSVVTSAAGKLEVSTEYILDVWSKYYYGLKA